MKHIITSAIAACALLASPPIASMAEAQQQNCPPGLQKKNPPCVPPGQARQGVTSEEWMNRHNIGSSVEEDDYVYLRDYDYDYWDTLPLLGPDEAYAVYDGGVVVLSQTSLTILRLIDILAY